MELQFDLDLLRAFLTVYRTGSFTRAADQLSRTQPAISLQLKRLEERLGAPVFVRDGRRIELTPDGEVLYGYARRLLDLHDEAVNRLTAPAVQGHLRLGIMEELGFLSLPKIVAGFARTFVKANLELQVKPAAELLGDLAQGRLDFAFASAEEGVPGVLPAWREALVWVADTDARPIAPQYGYVPLVTLHEPSRHRQIALDALARAGLRVEVVCTASTMLGVRAAVAAGVGIAAIGRGDLGPGLRQITGSHGRALPVLPDVQIGLYSYGSQSRRVADHLIEHVRRNL